MVQNSFPHKKFNGMTYIPGSTWFLYNIIEYNEIKKKGFYLKVSPEILLCIWRGFPLCGHQLTDQYMRLVWTLINQLLPSQPLVNFFFLRKVQPCKQNPVIAGEVVLTNDSRWCNFFLVITSFQVPSKWMKMCLEFKTSQKI